MSTAPNTCSTARWFTLLWHSGTYHGPTPWQWPTSYNYGRTPRGHAHCTNSRAHARMYSVYTVLHTHSCKESRTYARISTHVTIYTAVQKKGAMTILLVTFSNPKSVWFENQTDFHTTSYFACRMNQEWITGQHLYSSCSPAVLTHIQSLLRHSWLQYQYIGCYLGVPVSIL